MVPKLRQQTLNLRRTTSQKSKDLHPAARNLKSPKSGGIVVNFVTWMYVGGCTWFIHLTAAQIITQLCNTLALYWPNSCKLQITNISHYKIQLNTADTENWYQCLSPSSHRRFPAVISPLRRHKYDNLKKVCVWVCVFACLHQNSVCLCNYGRNTCCKDPQQREVFFKTMFARKKKNHPVSADPCCCRGLN